MGRRDAGRPGGSERALHVSPLQRRVLDLQRDAGNAAVTRLLQGQGAVVARAARRGRPARTPTGERMSLTIPGLLTRARVFSMTFGHGTSEEPRRAKKKLASSDVTLEVDAGSATGALYAATLRGDALPWASIASAHLTVVLSDAYIGSVQPGERAQTRLILSPGKVDVRS